jgi:hypothetical protein
LLRDSGVIASATISYATKVSKVHQITANIVMIDQMLAEFGPDVGPAREQLRSAVQAMVQKLWNEGNERSAIARAFTPTGGRPRNMAPRP